MKQINLLVLMYVLNDFKDHIREHNGHVFPSLRDGHANTVSVITYSLLFENKFRSEVNDLLYLIYN